MKILAPVKRVIDYTVKGRVKSDQSGVDLAKVKMSVNRSDEIAVEEAVHLKEAGTTQETVAVSIGPEKAQDQLRLTLAIGAVRAFLIKTDDTVEPLAVAKLLKKTVDEKKPKLVGLGKQAIDDDSNQTGQMVAALLGWAQGAFASEVRIEGGKASVSRESDGGLHLASLKLPSIVTTDLRLNEPRYASLPNIMKAKKKPFDMKEPGLVAGVFKALPELEAAL